MLGVLWVRRGGMALLPVKFEASASQPTRKPTVGVYSAARWTA